MQDKEMSFWDHLEDFRWTLLRSIIALLVFTIAAFALMPYIYDSVILAPTRGDFFLYKYLCIITSSIPFIPDFCDDGFVIEMVNINLTSQFFRHIEIYKSCAIWKWEKEYAMGIPIRNYHVFHRMCLRIFNGIPRNTTVFRNLPTECWYQKYNFARLLYGQLPNACFHHGNSIWVASCILVPITDWYN